MICRFDFYLGLDADRLMLVAADLPLCEWRPPVPLLPLMEHYWRVDVKEGEQVTQGDVWRFTTAARATPLALAPLFVDEEDDDG